MILITTLNELKRLTKHISCKCKCINGGRKCNSNKKWNNNKFWCELENQKEHNGCEKCYIWNSSTCSFENIEYLASIIEDLLITGDKIINNADSVSTNLAINIMSTVSTNYHNENIIYKVGCYILLTVLLVMTDYYL